MPRTPSVALAITCCAAVAAAAPAKAEAAAPTKIEKRLIHRINDVRAAHGIRRVRVSGRLQSGAHSWARHLRRADSFHHARLSSGTSEIIAWGTCSYATPRVIVRMWLNSGSHRPHLLDRSARRVGAGWSVGNWRSYRCVDLAVARFR